MKLPYGESETWVGRGCLYYTRSIGLCQDVVKAQYLRRIKQRKEFLPSSNNHRLTLFRAIGITSGDDCVYSTFSFALNRLLDRNYRGVGIDGIARAVGDFAVNLHAVPGEIGCRGGGSGYSAFPYAPCGRVALHVVPLVLES